MFLPWNAENLTQVTKIIHFDRHNRVGLCVGNNDEVLPKNGARLYSKEIEPVLQLIQGFTNHEFGRGKNHLIWYRDDQPEFIQKTPDSEKTSDDQHLHNGWTAKDFARSASW